MFAAVFYIFLHLTVAAISTAVVAASLAVTVVVVSVFVAVDW